MPALGSRELEALRSASSAFATTSGTAAHRNPVANEENDMIQILDCPPARGASALRPQRAHSIRTRVRCTDRAQQVESLNKMSGSGGNRTQAHWMRETHCETRTSLTSVCNDSVRFVPPSPLSFRS